MSVAMVLFLHVYMSSLRFKEESGKKAKPPFCDKKPRTRESNRREESSDSSLASIMTAVNMCTEIHSELLAIVRSPGNSVSCYNCGGDLLLGPVRTYASKTAVTPNFALTARNGVIRLGNQKSQLALFY
jgi:hypothetical protein